MTGGDDAQVELFALLQDVRPDVVRVAHRVVQVNLEADLGREARTGNRHRMAVQRVVDDVVVRDFPHAGAKHLLHQHHRLRPLYLDRRHVDLVDFDVVPGVGVDPLRPEDDIGIRDAEPELVIGHAEQHRVVDHAAVLIAQDHITRRHGWQQRVDVAGYQEVDECGGVRAFDLYLAFDRNVPHADVFGEVPVLLEQPTILGFDVGARVVKVVVNRVGPASRRLRHVPPR